MKTMLFALVAVLLAVGQIVTPAAAAASTSPALATCGDTYIVQRGDYLTKIAKTCGITYAALLAANPEIRFPSFIIPGQVVRLKADMTIPVTGSTYLVKRGDTLGKIAQAYGTTIWDLLRVNPQITNASLIFTGQVINLPAVTTGGPRVSLSTRSVKAGGTVDVSVAGFPANASIDYRISKEGAAFTAAVDGKTNASGAASVRLTIPSAAKSGEKWIVKVMTTELTKGTVVTSLTMTIQ